MSRNIAFPDTNKIPPHHMLNSPTSAAYCTLFFLWVHLQEALNVTTSGFTYTVPMYHVELETNLLVRIMPAVNVGLPSIGDRSIRWNVCSVYVLKSHRVLLVSGPRRKTMYSKQQKWESSTCDVVVFYL